MILANPLQGYRSQRLTKAERIAQPGRDLSDAELENVWQECEAEDVNSAFGRLIRILILTGQRRNETALMRWADLDEAGEWWTIPAEHAKNGISHEVPLPALARAVIKSAPRHEGCEYVFTTNGRFHNRLQGSNTVFFDPVVKGRGNRSDPIDVRAAMARLVQIVFFKSVSDGSGDLEDCIEVSGHWGLFRIF